MINKQSTLTFLGGAGSVTGAHFLFETGGKRILIDCGLLQGGGRHGKDENYEDFPYDPSTIDFLFITHAHADHIGRVPKLVKDGFRGTIYSTDATRDLSEVMFADAVRILAGEARNRGVEPMYRENDAAQALELWKIQDYHQKFSIGDDITVQLLDAGHILGAAMIEFERGGIKFVATGDLGNSPAPLLKDTDTLKDVQYILMESVYGDRAHEHREDRVSLLRDALIDTQVGGRLAAAADARGLDHTVRVDPGEEHRLDDLAGDLVVAAAKAQGGLAVACVVRLGQADGVGVRHVRAPARRRAPPR